MLLRDLNKHLKYGFILILFMLFACKSEKNTSQALPPQNPIKNEITSGDSKDQKAGPEKANTLVRVRYFYSTSHRCATCRKIETYAKKAVLENFSDELKSGKMEFSLVDMDLAENGPLVKQYKLFTKSVILSEHSDGAETRWNNLDKVWTLLHDEQAFASYVIKEVKTYLAN